jgi:hypothetical protein
VNSTLHSTAVTYDSEDMSRMPGSTREIENMSRKPSSAHEFESMSRILGSTRESEDVPRMRTSEILRGILTKNPGVKTFSVKRILSSIGDDRFEASLLMFSIPAIVPVPSPRGIVAIPTGVIASQLVSGEKQITLPPFILRKCVSRRSLAVAIHAALPILEAAEKVMRPRWNWVNHAVSRRALGLFVFVLAIAIAYPLFGFNAFHATSIFVISLGMAEQDGLAVMVGVAAGVLSLAILATSGPSVRALRAKVAKSLRKLGRKLGLKVFASFLERKGYAQLASLVTFEWSKLLWIWDPENPPHRAASRTRRAARRRARLASVQRRAELAQTRPDPAREPALGQASCDAAYEDAELFNRARLSSAAEASLSSSQACRA